MYGEPRVEGSHTGAGWPVFGTVCDAALSRPGVSALICPGLNVRSPVSKSALGMQKAKATRLPEIISSLYHSGPSDPVLRFGQAALI
jgi:hypothetical protein